MTNKKKIAILLPDGTGIKNYLYSSLLPKLANIHDVILISNLSDKILDEIRLFHNIQLKNIQLPKYKERVFEKFYREVGANSRLRRNAKIAENKTILPKVKKQRKGIGNKIFFFFVYLLALLCSKSIKLIVFIEKLHISELKKNKNFHKFIKLVSLNAIDLVFCTHQRAIIASPMIEAAKKCGIKTGSVIYSWDNIPKGRLAIYPDFYVLWSKYMKKEFHLFYPEVDLSNVYVTGTPQFEFYNKKDWYLTKGEFYKLIGVNDLSKRLICYSGDDTLTSPYDPIYLGDLAESLLELTEDKRPYILFRRCPVDQTDRFDQVIEKYKDLIIVSNPKWESSTQESKHWVSLYPTVDDIKLLLNVALHCDFVYNLGSTMAFDFAQFNKPACYINYDPVISKDWSVRTIYNLQHFRSMPSPDSVCWINSKDQILDNIKAVFKDPNLTLKSVNEWYSIINEGAKSCAADNIIDVINLHVKNNKTCI